VATTAPVVQSSNDDEPFIPAACMTPAITMTTGDLLPAIGCRAAMRPRSGDDDDDDDDDDVAGEEVVVSVTTTDPCVDNDELTAERAAEKMIERRIQVCFGLIYTCANVLDEASAAQFTDIVIRFIL